MIAASLRGCFGFDQSEKTNLLRRRDGISSISMRPTSFIAKRNDICKSGFGIKAGNLPALKMVVGLKFAYILEKLRRRFHA